MSKGAGMQQNHVQYAGRAAGVPPARVGHCMQQLAGNGCLHDKQGVAWRHPPSSGGGSCGGGGAAGKASQPWWRTGAMSFASIMAWRCQQMTVAPWAACRPAPTSQCSCSASALPEQADGRAVCGAGLRPAPTTAALTAVVRGGMGAPVEYMYSGCCGGGCPGCVAAMRFWPMACTAVPAGEHAWAGGGGPAPKTKVSKRPK